MRNERSQVGRRAGRVAVAVLMGTLVAGPGTVSAQPAPTPFTSFVQDLRDREYAPIRNNVERTIALIAAEHLEFRPVPAARTLREELEHVAAVNLRLCAIAQARMDSLPDALPARDTTVRRSLVEVRALVRESLRRCDEALRRIDDTAARERTVGPYMRFSHLQAMVTHMGHEYGRISVSLRLLGLVPPSSAGRDGDGAPAAPAASAPDTPAADTAHRMFRPENIPWGPERNGISAAVLEGSPARAGEAFTLAYRLADGAWIRPHYHGAAKRVAVLSGTLLMGMGDSIVAAGAQPMPAGSFGVVPAGTHHFEGARGETIVLFYGIGPLSTTFVDSRGNPAGAPAPARDSAWPRSTPEREGMDPAPLASFVARSRAGSFGNIDRLVVVANGNLVVDERFDRDYREISRGVRSWIGCGVEACRDSTELHQYNYLHPDWHPWHRGGRLHTLQSVTKSVTATLFGIAIARGEFTDVKAPLLSYFPGHDVATIDPRLRLATVEDLLTMRLGIEWHEMDRPNRADNTTLLLEQSPDWMRFTLGQPMDAVPGTKFTYNSGASALMAEVLRRATGVQAHEYAARHLFGPLGISDFHWKLTPTGHPDTEGGLYLEALDLAKVGQLYADDGVWRGRRILPAGWAATATARHVANVNPTVPTSPGYGYQWWRWDRRGVEVWTGNGFGGQFLFIVPAKRAVAVVNAWQVFGTPPQQPMASALLDALLDALRVPR